MIIHDGSEEAVIALKRPHSAVVASGTFDGVHVGHQKILSRLCELARERNGESVVVTYWPHPRFVLQANKPDLKLLSTFEEKADLFERAGVDHLVRIPFTKAFSRLSSHEFIINVLVNKISTRYLVIGYDHRFGKNREGSFDYLKEHAQEYRFDVEEIPRQDIDHIGVSSTKIRKAISEGDMHTANEYLGRPYSMTGIVASGQKIGRSIGFPTANLQGIASYKLIPTDGVYAARAKVGQQWYNGMMNIGFRPTVSGIAHSIEVHLFNFDQDIYGAMLPVHIYSRIRSEIKFTNLDALQAQLKEDCRSAMDILSQHL